MQRDISKDIEEKLGTPARKINLSELPPETRFMLNLMDLEAYDLYAIDVSKFNSTDSNKN